ncbi:CDP-glycerol:poly(glycerophosphate) glycerophosphotransferase [Bacillus sp. ZZV12-4809]|nr:CDP-glycerol:poly(glycerophosphate) glycerophosphotransferase [Bacillus sp. ZZV12-4809]
MLPFLKKIIIMTYKLLFQLVSMLPRKQNLIVFESYLGKQYSCNPRAIYEYLKKHYPEYNMIWSVDPRYESGFLEKGIPYAKRFTVKWLFVLARAKFWVTNSRMPLWIPKPTKTIYLQTWHGTPLKKLAFDMEEVLMPGTTTDKYKQEFLSESRNWDYLISPNEYSSKIFRRAFQFNKTIIESGYPRNDFLNDEANTSFVQEFKKKHSLPTDKKVILYAPTWRDNKYDKSGKYKFDIQLDLESLRNELGEDYIILLRMHYLIAQDLQLDSFKGFAFNFSSHDDIRELYLISDILITDYSSVFFDFAKLQRPIIFFVYDIEEYREIIRGFYFNLEEKAPGPIVLTTDEVIEEIKNISNNIDSHQKYNEFYQEFCYLEDGEAAKRVVEQVFLNS